MHGGRLGVALAHQDQPALQVRHELLDRLQRIADIAIGEINRKQSVGCLLRKLELRKELLARGSGVALCVDQDPHDLVFRRLVELVPVLPFLGEAVIRLAPLDGTALAALEVELGTLEEPKQLAELIEREAVGRV